MGSSVVPRQPAMRPYAGQASCREALRWRCAPGAALRERAGPDAEVTSAQIISCGNFSLVTKWIELFSKRHRGKPRPSQSTVHVAGLALWRLRKYLERHEQTAGPRDFFRSLRKPEKFNLKAVVLRIEERAISGRIPGRTGNSSRKLF